MVNGDPTDQDWSVPELLSEMRYEGWLWAGRLHDFLSRIVSWGCFTTTDKNRRWTSIIDHHCANHCLPVPRFTMVTHGCMIFWHGGGGGEMEDWLSLIAAWWCTSWVWWCIPLFLLFYWSQVVRTWSWINHQTQVPAVATGNQFWDIHPYFHPRFINDRSVMSLLGLLIVGCWCIGWI